MAAPTPVFSKSFNDGLQRLYDANEGDVTLICGPLNKKVHSLLLGARSKVFDTLCKGPFEEGLDKRIELKQQNPYLAARMLQHLYTFDYSGQKTSVGDDEESSHVSELHTHSQMYALGDKYDIKDLKEEALWKFNKAIEAKKGQSDELTSVVEVIPTVYATTPESDRGLRDAVVAFGANNLAQMKDLPDFKSAVTQVPTYMIEVLPGFLHRLKDERRRYKGTCRRCASVDQWLFNRVCCSMCDENKPLPEKEWVDAS